MEVEGLKRGLTQISADGLRPVVLVTDRHSSVKKLMADRFQDTLHYFDVWHLAKGKLMCAW